MFINHKGIEKTILIKSFLAKTRLIAFKKSLFWRTKLESCMFPDKSL